MTITEFIQVRQAENKPILMDGGTGTEILRRGIPTTLPLWSTEALICSPDAVREIHRDYARSGSELIIANTFRTQRGTLAKTGRGDQAVKLTHLACQLAREAAESAGVEHRVWVAGSAPPLEECYSPDLVPEQSIARREHRQHIQNLIDGGVDLVLVETMMLIRETVAALEAAADLDVPAAVSFCIDDQQNLLSGETLAETIEAISAYNPVAIMINCSVPETTTAALRELHTLTDIPLGAYANGMGEAHDDQGWLFEGGIPIADYLGHVGDWLDAGALFVGGCCGTTPEYIRRIADVLLR